MEHYGDPAENDDANLCGELRYNVMSFQREGPQSRIAPSMRSDRAIASATDRGGSLAHGSLFVLMSARDVLSARVRLNASIKERRRFSSRATCD